MKKPYIKNPEELYNLLVEDAISEVKGELKEKARTNINPTSIIWNLFAYKEKYQFSFKDFDELYKYIQSKK